MNVRSAIAVVILSCVTAGAQQPTSTWATAKPIVDKWDAEYLAAGRTIAASEQIFAAIRALLAEHPADVWAYEAAALGYNHLKLNDQAVGVMRDYLQRFPKETALKTSGSASRGNARSKLSSISSRVMPFARHSRISETDNLVPRTTSAPPKIDGSAIIHL